MFVKTVKENNHEPKQRQIMFKPQTNWFPQQWKCSLHYWLGNGQGNPAHNCDHKQSIQHDPVKCGKKWVAVNLQTRWSRIIKLDLERTNKLNNRQGAFNLIFKIEPFYQTSNVESLQCPPSLQTVVGTQNWGMFLYKEWRNLTNNVRVDMELASQSWDPGN